MSEAGQEVDQQRSYAPRCPVCRRKAHSTLTSPTAGLTSLLFGDKRYLCERCLIAFRVGWLRRWLGSRNVDAISVTRVEVEPVSREPRDDTATYELRPAVLHGLTRLEASDPDPLPGQRQSAIELNVQPLGIRLKLEIDFARIANLASRAMRFTGELLADLGRRVQSAAQNTPVKPALIQGNSGKGSREDASREEEFSVNSGPGQRPPTIH